LTNPISHGIVSYSEKTKEVIEMAVRVVKKIEGNDVIEGVKVMMEAMVDDYTNFMRPDTGIRKKMNKAFIENLDFTIGKKYIKVIERNGGVKAFVVNVDNDKKFKLGDVLLPAGWAAPARNFARGNVLDGGYTMGWTGPMYGY
tara:strand:- start:26 stop:454 length:429 start_codon:yes stop_codon:yes gene_type:complete